MEQVQLTVTVNGTRYARAVEPRRLLSDIHIKRCAGKNRRGDQRNKSESHGSTLL